MEQNKIILDEIKGWDKQTPAPLNWKSLIWGSCWQCIVRPDRLQQAWILPDEGHIQEAAASLGESKDFSLGEGLRKHHLSTHSQSFSLICLRVGESSSALRLLSTWGNSRTQGLKTQINNNIEPLSPFALTATTDPGGEFLFPEQKQAIEQQFLPKHNRKKAAAGVLQLISNE